MTRYLRAFWIALKMTLRGETLQSPMQAWLAGALSRLDAVERIARRESLDPAALTLTVDMRQISMATILGTIRHNLTESYPRLLREPGGQGRNLLYAANVGDHFRLIRLETALPEDSAIRQAVAELSAHLEAIPPGEG